MADLYSAWADHGKDLLEQLKKLTKEVAEKVDPATKLTMPEYYKAVQLVAKMMHGQDIGSVPEFRAARKPPASHRRHH